ncbi:MAG: hypothetical protein V5A50_12245, partial [Thiohalorhabdus sp.]
MSNSMVVESIIQRGGGSDYRMNRKTYHFRPADLEAHSPHLCLVEDPDDLQGFLAIKEGFRVYKGDKKPPEDSGVTPDRDLVEGAQPEPAPAETREPEQGPAWPEDPEAP